MSDPASVTQAPLKVLVFAHVPPPHHGQSYMVQLMLAGFGGDHRKRNGSPPSAHTIECYHVNARVSKRLEDIGEYRMAKLLLMMWYCLEAIWCRFRYGVETFYYIPAPGKKSALYRDWLVMFLCRPFFKRLILHWHAAGLAKWLETCRQIRARALTYRFMKNVDLSIVLSNYNRADAEKLLPKSIRIVSNGILDPCPDFDRVLLPLRQRRREARARLLRGESIPDSEIKAVGDPRQFRILYLAHCMREKGLFDTISGVLLANRQLAARRSPVSLQLSIAGNFVSDELRAEFDEIMARPEAARCFHYAGFVTGDVKDRLLREADLFCFPTFYQNENQPVNLIEAMAFGIPIVTTRWRSLPEMFPVDYPGLVPIQSPDKIAEAIQRLLVAGEGESFRRIFERNFTLESYLNQLATAIRSVESLPRGEAVGTGDAQALSTR